MPLKGISPLLAVVMLIAFTLLIAGIIGGLATQFAREQSTQIRYCSGARTIILSGAYRDAGSGLSDVTLSVQNFGDVDLSFIVLQTYQNSTVVKLSNSLNIPAGEIQQITLQGIDISDTSQFTIQSKECSGAQDLIRTSDLRQI